MATQTTHFDMVKQQSPERVSVGLLNDNFDIIDGVMFANQEKSDQMADDYNASETYNTGDYVRRENYLYKCNTDNTTGTWDDTKWDRVKVMDEISQCGGGGSSTLAGLNDVDLSSPTDGQLLGYNGTSHKWENVTGGGGGSSTFAGLNDVNVAGVANKDIARFNSSTNKWEKSSALTDLELAVSQISASTLGITDGHTILDSDGTAMAQEDDLQFASGYVEDDSVNGKTVYIEMIRISQANYDTLKANGQLKPGAKYFIYDAQPVAVNASNLPYSSTQSTKQKIDNVESSIPTSASDLPYSSTQSTEQKIDSFEWKLLDSKNLSQAGSLAISIPATATELYINFIELGLQLFVPTVALTQTGRYFQNGFYLASNNYGGIAVEISKYTIGYATDSLAGSFRATQVDVYYKG